MTELACASGLELLMDYLEGELPAELRASIDAHVAGCPKCVAFLASYLATPRIVREATDAPLPIELRDSLRARLRRSRKSAP